MIDTQNTVSDVTVNGNNNYTGNIITQILRNGKPEDYKNVANLILAQIYSDNLYEASLLIQGAKEVKELPSSIVTLLKIIDWHYQILKNKVNYIGNLEAILSDEKDPLTINIAEATLFINKYIQNYSQNTIEYNNKNTYETFIRIAILNEKDLILSTLNNKKHFNDFEKICLIKGLIKNQDFLDALNFTNSLINNFSNFKQEKAFLCEVCILEVKVYHNNLEKINNEDVYKLKELTAQYIKDNKNKEGLSQKECFLIVGLIRLNEQLLGINEVNQDLKSLFEKHRSTIFQHVPQIHPVVIIPASEINHKLKNLEALTSDESRSLSFLYPQNTIDKQVFYKWLDNHPDIINVSDIEKDIQLLLLKCRDYDFIMKHIENIDHEIKNLVETYPDEIKDIELTPLSFISHQLIGIHPILTLTMRTFLEHVMPKEGSSLLSIKLLYFQCLLQLNKYKTIQNEYIKLDNQELTFDLNMFYTQFFLQIHDYQNAQTVINAATKQRNFAGIWDQKLRIDYHLKTPQPEMIETLKTIPNEVFESASPSLPLLIDYIATNIDLKFAATKYIQLFFQNPNHHAFEFFNFLIKHEAQQNIIDQVLTNLGIIRGLSYKKDLENEHNILLISPDTFPINKPNFLLEISSQLGLCLEQAIPTGKGKIGIADITDVKEKNKVECLAYIANKLLEDNQQNIGSYKRFSIREGYEIEDFKNAIQSLPNNKNNETINNIKNNNDLFLYTKGKCLYNNGYTELDAAYTVLLDINCNANLHNDSFMSKDFTDLTLDIYSFIYLCITNQYLGLVRLAGNIYITQETANAIQVWLDNIEENGDVKLINHEARIQFFEPWIKSIRNLLEYIKIAIPEVIDYPDYIDPLSSLISPSCISTYKLCYTNNTPWFCLDPNISYFMTKDTAYNNVSRIINIKHIINTINQRVTFDEKKAAFQLYVNHNLFIGTIQKQDIETLLQSTDPDDQNLAKQIQKKIDSSPS